MATQYTIANRKLWSSLTQRKTGPKVLVEEIRTPFTYHLLGVHTVVLNQSKDYQPVYLGELSEEDMDLVRSYVPSASNVTRPWVTRWDNWKINILVIWQFLKLKFGARIISLNLFGVKYGDLLYDQYLAKYKVGTIRKIDDRFKGLLRLYIEGVFQYRKLIKSGAYSAILVSHRIGLLGGLLTRLGAKYGLEIYSSMGQHYNTLLRTNRYENVICYGYQPLQKELDYLINHKNFDSLYNEFIELHTAGKLNKEMALAYEGGAEQQLDKATFCEQQGFDPEKKIVFIMMQALNDWPHSTFVEDMFFDDYYDWLMTTLYIAKEETDVNWVFKQHPYIHLYPTNDLDFNEVFRDLPDHIKYLDADQSLNALGVAKVADVVITNSGSAGYEIPALGHCYGITPSQNHYNGFGFTVNPKSLKEYKRALQDIPSSGPLSKEKKKLAQAMFLFISKYATIKMLSNPHLNYDESRRKDMKEWYWDRVMERYTQHGDKILKQVQHLAEQLKSPDYHTNRSLYEID